MDHISFTRCRNMDCQSDLSSQSVNRVSKYFGIWFARFHAALAQTIDFKHVFSVRSSRNDEYVFVFNLIGSKHWSVYSSKCLDTIFPSFHFDWFGPLVCVFLLLSTHFLIHPSWVTHALRFGGFWTHSRPNSIDDDYIFFRRFFVSSLKVSMTH